jgi:hypothetical protein
VLTPLLRQRPKLNQAARTVRNRAVTPEPFHLDATVFEELDFPQLAGNEDRDDYCVAISIKAITGVPPIKLSEKIEQGLRLFRFLNDELWRIHRSTPLWIRPSIPALTLVH